MDNLRYRKIKFKDFSGGRGQKKYDKNNPTKFLTSEFLEHDFEYKSLRISPDYNPLWRRDGSEVYGDFYRAITIFADMAFYFTKITATSLIELWRRSGFGNMVLKFTFHADYNNFKYCLSYRNKVVAFLYNTTLSKNVVAYSIDYGTSWTYVDWDYGTPIGHTKTPDGMLYIVTYTGEIITTTDLATFTLLYDGSTATERITSVENLDGFVYITLLLRSDNASIFCRLDDDELTYLHEIKGASSLSRLKVFDNRLFFTNIVNGIIYLYEYDKGDVILIDYIDEYTFYDCSIEVADNDHMYIVASNDSGDWFSRLIYAMNSKNSIFKVKDFTHATDTISIHSLDLQRNRLVCHTHNHTGSDNEIHDTDNVALIQATGNIELPVIDIGAHIPAYLLVKHSKLPGPNENDQQVLVYVKRNLASSWTLALTSGTKDALRKLVKLTNTESVDFIQFKIVLSSTTLAKTDIEDLSFTYFYIPSGIENSKE